jgi:hypothetical protein
VLIECKSARLTLGAQAGDGSLAEVSARYLGRARAQIDATAAQIRAGAPGFSSIPADRAIVGMAVTSEPFYLGNSKLIEYGTASDTPSISLSLRDLERWTSMTPDAAVRALLDVLFDEDMKTWSFSIALKDNPDAQGRNPILDHAWHQFDYMSSPSRPTSNN